MVRAMRIPPLSEGERDELERRRRETSDARARERYQVVLLAARGKRVAQIAAILRLSQATVRRVLHRYLEEGIRGIARTSAPGRHQTVTPEWEARLLCVIERAPHEVGLPGATWTTALLAAYLAGQTGIQVTPETVRLYLHANDYVYEGSTWTLKAAAPRPPDRIGKA